MHDNELHESKILLVEDEETLAAGLEYNLTEEGYEVVLAKDGRFAMELFKDQKYDLVILDIMLPYLNGFEIAEKIRTESPQIPILFLTAKTGITDKIKGFQLGADDYLTKPFHLQELLVRVKRMLERTRWYKNFKSNTSVYWLGDTRINFENLNCMHKGNEFRLTPIEATVVKYLLDHKNKIVSRKELLENVWHLDPGVETRTVDIFIARLRKYFEPDPSNPKHIISIRGAGYMLKEK